MADQREEITNWLAYTPPDWPAPGALGDPVANQQVSQQQGQISSIATLHDEAGSPIPLVSDEGAVPVKLRNTSARPFYVQLVNPPGPVVQAEFLRRAANQTMVNGDAFIWDTEEDASGAMWDVGTPDTITIQADGPHNVFARFEMKDNNAGTICGLYLELNGTTKIDLDVRCYATYESAASYTPGLSMVHHFSAGDTLKLKIVQDTGGGVVLGGVMGVFDPIFRIVKL